METAGQREARLQRTRNRARIRVGGVVISFSSMIRLSTRLLVLFKTCTHLARARPHNGLHSPSIHVHVCNRPAQFHQET